MFLRQLEYFCAVANTHSFHEAADKCYVSQSAISQQVKALEKELGAPLTERRGRGFVLTRAGEVVARRGQQILEDAMRLKFEVSALRRAPVQLRVGYLNRYAGWELQAALAAFARRHPDVILTARAGDHEALHEAILAGQLDILVNDRRRQLSDEWENRPLFTGYSYIEASEASELAFRESVTVTELKGMTCIIVADDDQRETERSYHRDVLNFDCPFVYADTLDEARMLVAGNRGFLPLMMRSDEGVTGTVIRRIPLVDASGAHRRQEFFAFWPKAATTSLTEEFAEILAELFS